MKQTKKWVSVLTAAAMLCTGIGAVKTVTPIQASAADSIEDSMNWDTLNIGGGGFVSGIITGDDQMYAAHTAMTTSRKNGYSCWAS